MSMREGVRFESGRSKEGKKKQWPRAVDVGVMLKRWVMVSASRSLSCEQEYVVDVRSPWRMGTRVTYGYFLLCDHDRGILPSY